MRTRIEVYYDGWCPICTRLRNRLERLDWLGRLQWRSIREQEAATALGVPVERLEQRMHVRHPHTGRIVDGIWAVAAVAGRLPTLMPLWPLLVGAGAIGLGQPLYDYIAARRAIVPVGQCADRTCQIHHQGE